MTRAGRRTRKPSDQVAASDERTEQAQAEMAATTQRLIETAARVEESIPEEVLPEWDDSSAIHHIQEMRAQLAEEPLDVTSSWRPISIVFDGKGGFTLTAFDGTTLYVDPACSVKVSSDGRGNIRLTTGTAPGPVTEMVIQRKDNPNLIQALGRSGVCADLVARLTDENDRFQSIRIPADVDADRVRPGIGSEDDTPPIRRVKLNDEDDSEG